MYVQLSTFKTIEIHALLQTVHYWIDFTDNGTEGKWVTLSTGRSEYTSWDRGQPDNWRGNQNCAYNNFRKRAGRWDDGGCKAKFQAMCEASGIFNSKCFSKLFCS